MGSPTNSKPCGNRRQTTGSPLVRDLLPNDVTSQGHSLIGEWNATDSLTIRSITGYRKLDNFQNQDYLTGALGPLQGEPVNAVLTITFAGEATGTRIVMEYVVGGTMRFQREQIGPAVDGVLGDQLARLAALYSAQAKAGQPSGDLGSDFLSGVGAQP